MFGGGVGGVPPPGVPLVIAHVVWIVGGVAEGWIGVSIEGDGPLRSRTGLAKLVREGGIRIRQGKLGAGTGNLLEARVVVGTVEDELAEGLIALLAEFVSQEAGKPAVPRHHSFFGGCRGGLRGIGCQIFAGDCSVGVVGGT